MAKKLAKFVKLIATACMILFALAISIYFMWDHPYLTTYVLIVTSIVVYVTYRMAKTDTENRSGIFISLAITVVIAPVSAAIGYHYPAPTAVFWVALLVGAALLAALRVIPAKNRQKVRIFLFSFWVSASANVWFAYVKEYTDMYDKGPTPFFAVLCIVLIFCFIGILCPKKKVQADKQQDKPVEQPVEQKGKPAKQQPVKQQVNQPVKQPVKQPIHQTTNTDDSRFVTVADDEVVPTMTVSTTASICQGQCSKCPRKRGHFDTPSHYQTQLTLANITTDSNRCCKDDSLFDGPSIFDKQN